MSKETRHNSEANIEVRELRTSCETASWIGHSFSA